MARWAGEAERVPALLLREALPDVTVRMAIPDNLPEYLPLIVVRRTSGGSLVPRFWDGLSVNVQCWSDATDDLDPVSAASDLADQARRVLWEAWDNQTVTSVGHIVHLRESQGPMEVPDVDLPRLGRYVATYALRIRSAA
jgi:hypothetical protein